MHLCCSHVVRSDFCRLLSCCCLSILRSSFRRVFNPDLDSDHVLTPSPALITSSEAYPGASTFWRTNLPPSEPFSCTFLAVRTTTSALCGVPLYMRRKEWSGHSACFNTPWDGILQGFPIILIVVTHMVRRRRWYDVPRACYILTATGVRPLQLPFQASPLIMVSGR